MDIMVLGDKDTVLGFKLAGIPGAVYEESKELVKEVYDAKILIVTESIAQKLREKNLELDAVLAEIPDKTGSKGLALKNISRLFESAIGVKLKE